MRNRAIVLLMVSVFLIVTSCATIPEEHKGAAKGAGVGAAAGAVLGAVVGGDTKSAVIGGLLGALVGGAIGHYYYDQSRTRTETADRYGYRPTQGPLIRIEGASVEPQTAAPGGKVDMKLTYAVLTPAETTELTLVEKREIRHEGSLVGNPEITVVRKGGTYTSSIPLTLPADAKKGLYVVTSTVRSGQLSETIQSAFSVR
ncbi:MAG: glycine zipper 2TM domain-containing protein [Syntrophobacterales bacterium]|nr:glycine zipper 2TM domain-containing protein [Syntrophobacterales bacterium]